MIKRIFAFLLLFVPTCVNAEMIGAGGEQRRYVTDTEKETFPYNTVVNVMGYSAGTIIAPHLILTCGHCVEFVGEGNTIDFYTSDGKIHMGEVLHISERKSFTDDWALITTKETFEGPFLNIAKYESTTNNVSRIGFDSLKVMSASEINTVRNVYRDIIKNKYGGKIRNDKSDKVFDELEKKLMTKYLCKSADDENCVHCIGNGSCIFNDRKRMKIQEHCSITSLQRGYDYTNCMVSPGVDGSALIDNNAKSIIGILYKTQATLGAFRYVESLAVSPNKYYSYVKEELENGDF